MNAARALEALESAPSWDLPDAPLAAAFDAVARLRTSLGPDDGPPTPWSD